MPGTSKSEHTSSKHQKRGEGQGAASSSRSPQKGGQVGLDASIKRSKADRSALPKKAAETRKPTTDRAR